MKTPDEKKEQLAKLSDEIMQAAMRTAKNDDGDATLKFANALVAINAW